MKKKPKRKTRKNRKDVHCKKIIRRCRKHFQDLLNSETEYMMRKRARDSDFFKRSLDEVLTKHVTQYAHTPELRFFLACLVYPKDTSKNLDTLIPKAFSPA
jgi:hypothetical protein